MKTLVVGAGAVGGYFGGRLLAAGRDITFLVRPQRAAKLRTNGLRIHSQYGDVHIPAPPTVTAEQLREPFDLVILSCKAQDLASVIEAIPPAVGANTAILPLLNGMSHMETLRARFGKDRLLGGFCAIGATLGSGGDILHLNQLHFLSYGEMDGSRSERIERVRSLMDNAGFTAKLSDNILLDMWGKWVFISTGAGITCLMRAPIGDIVEAGASDVAEALLEETAAIAAAEGYPTPSEVLTRVRATVTEPGSSMTASMLRDVENHAPTEADHILGDLLERAGKHGISAPLLRVAYAHLKSYEARRNREINTAKVRPAEVLPHS